MNCLEEDVLVHLALNELPEAEERSATAHVATCQACAARVNAVKQLGAAIAAAPTVQSSLTAEEVAARAFAAPAPAPRVAWQRTVLALAASLVAVSGAVAVWRMGPSITARGSTAAWPARVTAEVLAVPGGAVKAGSKIGHHALFTASTFGLASGDSLFLASFIVDAKKQVHWVAPVWVDEATVPSSVAVASDAGPMVTLESAMQFDLEVGPSLAVTILSTAPISVRDVERITPVDTDTLVRALGSTTAVRVVPFEVMP